MKLLLIGMADSIHVVKWINQINQEGWNIHLFPSIDICSVHPDMSGVTVHHSFYWARDNRKKANLNFRGIPLPFYGLVLSFKGLLNRYIPNYRAAKLGRLIKKLKPDIIHSIEIQHAGYLTLEAMKVYQQKLPPWIVTNYGSDIYLFGRLPEHKQKISEVLTTCDFYSCECKRDVELAKKMGFSGKILPVFPNSGGLDLKTISRFKQNGKTSDRRNITIKGYQGWAGRALVGLRALERCADILSGYEINIILLAPPEVIIAAALFQESTGITVNIIPEKSPHYDILKIHGSSRISIGLSISDAISTSLLEAMAMGSFPIQSWTACADEWIVDGETGFLVHPNDPETVEKAIRKALTDDELVNQAAIINNKVIEERLDVLILKNKAIEFYKEVAKEKLRYLPPTNNCSRFG
ncbi:MAG: hypothetical protein C0403_15785 [Desulfobacterium sp.]|nr:hypothetical protein [Desulfobacterium sp.]